MKKSISRYTSEVPTGRTLAEIHGMLVENGALAIMTEYNSEREPKAISFRIQTEYGLIAFQLPARVEQVGKILATGRRRAHPQTIRQQACRTAWRIIRDWLEAQLAMTRAGLVSMTEIFLPYAQDSSGRTFYEAAKAARFPGLLLQDKAP
jgi:hypothetical protein